MYFLLFILLMIFGAMQEWALTARVYDWLASENPAEIAVLQILLSFALSAFLGIKLFSRVGPQLLRKAQQQLAMGQVPDRTLAQGILLIAGALCLILPGYLSDLLGVLLVVLRVPLGSLLLKIFKKKLAKGGVRFGAFGQNGFSASYGSASWTQHKTSYEAPQERIGDSPIVIDVEPLDDKK